MPLGVPVSSRPIKGCSSLRLQSVTQFRSVITNDNYHSTTPPGPAAGGKQEWGEAEDMRREEEEAHEEQDKKYKRRTGSSGKGRRKDIYFLKKSKVKVGLRRVCNASGGREDRIRKL